jgi:hypothetical protein
VHRCTAAPHRCTPPLHPTAARHRCTPPLHPHRCTTPLHHTAAPHRCTTPLNPRRQNQRPSANSEAVGELRGLVGNLIGPVITGLSRHRSRPFQYARHKPFNTRSLVILSSRHSILLTVSQPMPHHPPTHTRTTPTHHGPFTTCISAAPHRCTPTAAPHRCITPLHPPTI